MSLAAQFQNFRDNARIVFNDRFIGDQGALELSKFIADHRKIEVLEIKSNDISAEGFKQIFEALTRNSSLRQLIIEYNNLGQSQYDDWQQKLSNLIDISPKFQRINISNNKITSEAFKRIIPSIAASKSLRLIEIRYNSINSTDVDFLVGELKRSKNQTLLYVQLSGNKIKKQSIDALEAILKNNRAKSPISKDKLLMTGGVFSDNADRNSSANVGTFYMNKTNAIDDLSKQNVVRHLEEILDQNRKDTAQMKIRLERELQDLLKRQKNDARQLQDLESKCNQLVIQNRNIKFQLDRTVSQHQQMQRDQELHLRVHEEKLREANKELQDMEQKYEQIEERMQKEHDMKMKEVAREWEARLRSVEEKIRTVENENNQIDIQIKKGLEKRERVRVEYLQEENQAKNRIQEEQAQRYGFKLSSLQSKLREVQETREKLIRRNQDLLYEIQKTQANSLKENAELEQEINDLKLKEQEFTVKNKQFLTRNERLKSQIQLKEITIQKLEQELNRLNEEIDIKKKYNRQQVDKIILDNTDIRRQKEQQKRQQIEKLNQLETSLRNAQLENAKLRQQYGVLAQRLHVNLGRAIQQVFSENNLF